MAEHLVPEQFPRGIADATGGRAFLRDQSNLLVALDLKTSKVLWRTTTPMRPLLVRQDKVHYVGQFWRWSSASASGSDRRSSTANTVHLPRHRDRPVRERGLRCNMVSNQRRADQLCSRGPVLDGRDTHLRYPRARDVPD